ncbi:hypothetical protein OG342_04800 [Streptomyces bobili]|uniref:hypothetical protein n=1 Tax=Streptomyces bobili TaxID=67280 RepID=UPI002252C57B|nr:hypothetical protein [Streptomyces bobili]MCX5522187.1 hypothetical protein [Streptomyces bobili]
MSQERDLTAWRELARVMPCWRPTLAGLRKLDEGPNELVAAFRSIARGWSRDDARWDVLQGVLEFYRRQRAHELAETVREEADRRQVEEEARFGHLDHESELQLDGMRTAAKLIDPKAQRASTEGDTP